MSVRHTYAKKGDVSDALMSLAETPAESVDTRTFIEAIFPSIQAARERHHTFKAIAQVISDRLGYSISASTVCRHYNAIVAESRARSKPQSLHQRDPFPQDSTAGMSRAANSKSRGSPTRKPRKQSARPDTEEPLSKAVSETVEGDRAVAAVEETRDDRPESDDATTIKNPVLTDGHIQDLTKHFHLY